MEITNKYFVLTLPQQALEQIFAHTVETVETARYTVEGVNPRRVIVKLPSDNVNVPNALNGFPVYNHEGIRQYIRDNSSEWETEEII